MADWTTISSLATAGGTLVLALATFSSVRSSNRSAQATERMLMAGISPLVVNSRLQDEGIKVGFADNHWVKVPGGSAVAEVVDDVVYLVVSLRNVGSGIAVLDRWDLWDDMPRGADATHRELDTFRRLTRDIYIPAGDVGFWQGAFRDTEEDVYKGIRKSIEDRQPMTLDLLYSDHEGGQHTVSRLALIPRSDDLWMVTTGRHWNLDRADPR